MRMLLKISQNKNTLLFKVSPNQNINPILGRIVDIIPIKKRKFLLKKQLDTETVIKLIELHALMLS